MAGTFPGIANSQQNDLNGKPLVGGKVSVFNGGTSVLADLFQDIGLSLAQQNPLELDASGRVPMFFVADGTYRVRLVDKFGSTANGGFDLLQVPSIGASSSGGGGSAVDQTTVASTGDCKWRLTAEVLSGWVRLNGKTIGSATSGGSERANADCQSSFEYLWNNFSDALCPVTGGRGANAAADWIANKPIQLPDLRGRSLVGVDTMGNITAGRLTAATFTAGDAATPYSQGGEAAHLLTAAESAKLSYAGSLDVTASGLEFDFGIGSGTGGPGASPPAPGAARSGTGHTDPFNGHVGTADATEITTNAGAQPHNNMPPFGTVTFYMKL